MRLPFFISLLLLIKMAGAQNFSNKGTEFWVGYGHNQLFNAPSPNMQSMVLYLSADQAANVTVSVNGTSWVRTYAVPANTAMPTDLIPKSGVDDCRITAEGLFTRGIHIVSDVPIVAYAHTYGVYSSGGTMLLPVESYSYTYYSVNPEQSASNSYSWFYVMASENNTTVRITPSRPTDGGQLQNVPFVVTLQKGQLYNVMGKINGNSSYDLSGSKIQSLPGADGICHPVGVFSGSSRTYICATDPFASGSDYVMQQVFPLNAWGNKYITAPSSASTGAAILNNNKYRIYIREPNTLVRKNGVLMSGLINNFFYDFSSAVGDVITATKPVLMAQFIPSATGCGTTGLGDPEMFIISPVEQAIKNVVFYNTDKETIAANFLTMVIPQNGISSLRIDGSPAFDYSYPHPNATGYAVVVKQLPLTPGQHTARSDSAFTAITYGLGEYESYGYNAGSNLRNLESVVQVKNVYGPAITAHTCAGTPFHPVFKTTYRPSSITWHLSQVTGLTPNADITLSNYPIPSDSVVEFQRKFYLYQLPGTYTFSSIGTYTIPVTLTDQLIENCRFSTSLNIPVSVIAGPDVDFSSLLTQCAHTAIAFTGNSTGSILNNKWLWNFGDGSIDSVRVVNKTYNQAGTYPVSLMVVRTDGCIADTQKQVTIQPVSRFSLSQVLCEGQSFEGYSSTGIYVDTLVAANGCDSIRTLDLTVKPKSYSLLFESICAGQSFEGYTNAGIYMDTFPAANGCDSIRTLNLTVRPVANVTVSQTICEGQSFEGHTTGGVYTQTLVAANGCDSIRTLNLTVLPRAYATITQTICEGEQFEGHTTSGVYTQTFVAANGCDSIRTLQLTVKPKSYSTITHSICAGQSFEGHSTSGVYVQTFVAANGCDSIRTLNLLVHPISYVTHLQTICEGQSYEGHSTTGVYSQTLVGANGCDSIRTLQLTVLPKSFVTVNQSICEGQQFEGHTASGVYVQTLVAANGCDSIRTLNLTVLPKTFVNVLRSICEGDQFEGHTVSGSYSQTFIGANGCDSTRTVNLTVKPKSYSSVTQSICEGGSFEGFTTTGVHVRTLMGVNGCDSIRTINLTVKAKGFSAITTSVCEGDSFEGYSSTGVYIKTFTGANGCDSTRTVTLTVIARVATSINKTICAGQEFEGYNRAGVYVDRFYSAAGCDSVRTLRLSVTPNPSPYLGSVTTLCLGDSMTLSPGAFDSYRWQDGSVKDHLIVKSPGVYTVTVTNSCGSQTALISITGKVCQPYFPNAFTPNNDGVNDVFKMLNAPRPQAYLLLIYNRYGQKIFETRDYLKGWDGTVMGQPASPGAYVWQSRFGQANAPVHLQGTILLIR